MTNGMPVMAGITPPEFRDLADVATDGYAMSQYTFINHTGTHVDAPAHQIAGGASLDDIPLDRLVTDALTIDLTGHDPGPVGPADLGGALDQDRPGDIVLDRMWLGAGKIIIENLAGLAELPARCRIVVAPLKVRGANGGPARVLAFLDE